MIEAVRRAKKILTFQDIAEGQFYIDIEGDLCVKMTSKTMCYIGSRVHPEYTLDISELNSIAHPVSVKIEATHD